jgi:uncharacterized membrane protein
MAMRILLLFLSALVLITCAEHRTLVELEDEYFACTRDEGDCQEIEKRLNKRYARIELKEKEREMADACNRKGGVLIRKDSRGPWECMSGVEVRRALEGVL